MADMDMSDGDELAPIKILIDELRNDDPQARLKSIRRLSTIATALGAERTRDELVPYLNEMASEMEDEDEVLLAMAEELGGLIPHVGGKAYAHVLLTPLETLCATEEALVRDKAVESVKKVIESMAGAEERLVPLLKRLATGDYNSTHIASAPLFSAIYPSVSAGSQGEMRSMFAQLCRDDIPMVRKAACQALGGFGKVVSVNHLHGELIPLFAKLAADEQDSVRIVAVENCVTLGKILSPEQSHLLILPIIRLLHQDKGWRVRYMVAERYCELADTQAKAVVESEMTAALVKFLKDSEPEVRTAAAFKVTGFCERVSVGVTLQHLMPCARDLAVDSSHHVRAALASVIMGLAPVLGKNHTIEQLVPLFLSLLKDEHHEARLNIISKLDSVNQVMGVDSLSQSLLPAIIELAEDRQWRVRLAIIEHIPLLASQLGAAFFEERLAKMCITWLADSVSTVRGAAIANLKRLTEVFGVEWAAQNIMPQVLELCVHSNYLYRMTAISAVAALGGAVGRDSIKGLLPAVVQASKDPVPNCRFNASKALQALAPFMEGTAVDRQIRPTLQTLTGDDDPDVQFFARTALTQLKAL
eukprot:CAMPEP_0173421322 /NCGR_PEP_ID=MMETSP1357-20121228/2477_1 /TAXON_ID=77926 /ORGANISM="Hemiselmis rufescens, Strain PCC563" /LENGTH=587 /DNA_ID=CAMNT_0014384227 /DNA_START=49 /DNA_END=1812 /DNA_ORIENTATION=-